MKNIRWEIRNTVDRLFSINAKQVQYYFYCNIYIANFHKILINCHETAHGISK